MRAGGIVKSILKVEIEGLRNEEYIRLDAEQTPYRCCTRTLHPAVPVKFDDLLIIVIGW
jgi:hypothetical protein